jgi:tetratricopeptide (TPR) repeat protein
MPSPPHLTLRTAACLSALCLAAGCSSPETRAQDALGAYQVASAANDLAGQRKALLQLVQAKEDVADYWIQLGKLEASMGSYGDANYAFTRAYELDRSNPDVLQYLTESSVRSGDLDSAERHAKELDVVSPGSTWAKVAHASSALRDNRFDEALTISEQLLANSPLDPAATVIKGRALIGLQRVDEAQALLLKQVRSQPTDVGSAKLLVRVLVRKQDWPTAAAVAVRIARNLPSDQQNALFLVEAAFRSGNVKLGRAASAGILKPGQDPELIEKVLSIWVDYWPSPQRLQDARMFANAAPGLEQKLAYAAFLSRQGAPEDAFRLVSDAARLPVAGESAEANAIVGDALWRMGKFGEGKTRLDAVIAYDPGNASALRSRAELELKTGDPAAALVDAQKLVSVLPNSPNDRLLLARSYLATGNKSWNDRTLCSAASDEKGRR